MQRSLVFLEHVFYFPHMAKLPVLCVMWEGSKGAKYPAENGWLLHKICKQQPKVEVHLVTASMSILNARTSENKKNSQSAAVGYFTDYHSAFIYLLLLLSFQNFSFCPLAEMFNFNMKYFLIASSLCVQAPQNELMFPLLSSPTYPNPQTTSTCHLLFKVH